MIQGMVIRIRDFAEMFVPFTKNTIWDSSKTMKSYPLFGDNDQWKEDIGIKQALGKDGRMLDSTEPLVVVSHGSQPTLNKDGTVSGKFGGRTPEELAQEISRLLPDDYGAEIFLNGCYTGMRIGYTQAGTSYIERFGVALLKLVQGYTGIVKGNIGAASTFSQNEELITIDKATFDTWKDDYPLAVATNKASNSYYMRGPYGQARYKPSDQQFNDFGYRAMLGL